MADAFSCFVCPNCHSEIQASLDMIGQATECPVCGTRLVIPKPQKNDVMRHQVDDVDPDSVQAMKSRTIRIDLGDF